jgi:hypothetical protein
MGEEEIGVRLREQVTNARSFFTDALKAYADSPIAPIFVGKGMFHVICHMSYVICHMS